MPTDLPKERPGSRYDAPLSSADATNVLLGFLAVPTLLLTLMAALPLPLVLPAFGLATFFVGVTLGAWALLCRRAAASLDGLLDAAGLLVLIGFIAFMMTDLQVALAALAERGGPVVQLRL